MAPEFRWPGRGKKKGLELALKARDLVLPDVDSNHGHGD